MGCTGTVFYDMDALLLALSNTSLPGALPLDACGERGDGLARSSVSIDSFPSLKDSILGFIEGINEDYESFMAGGLGSRESVERKLEGG